MIHCVSNKEWFLLINLYLLFFTRENFLNPNLIPVSKNYIFIGVFELLWIQTSILHIEMTDIKFAFTRS